MDGPAKELHLGFCKLLSNPGSIRLTIFASSEAYKYIFTSPSSVEKGDKATRSGNARIHGMTRVTHGSIAYVATQVRT